MNEMVVLVDELNNETGVMDKLGAHLSGRLHRAVSVFIFNSRGEMLLQQRAAGKYHSAGLWSNTCCSHPRPGEPIEEAAHRRLFEEMGLKCGLQEIFTFIYKADLENNLTEFEFDHVFSGICDDVPQPDPEEVAAWKYVPVADVEKDVAANPDHYSAWFKICLTEQKEELFNKTNVK